MKLPALNSVLGGYLLFTFLYFVFLIFNVLGTIGGSDILSSVVAFLDTQIDLLYYFVWFWVILMMSSTLGMVYQLWKTKKFQVDTFFFVFVLSSIVIFCKLV